MGISLKGIGVTAIALFVAGLVAFILDAFDLKDRWFPRPSLAFIVPREPGPILIFDPQARTLAFEFSFDADNSGNASETIVATTGNLVGAQGVVAHFSSVDINCAADGVAVTSFPAESLRSVQCVVTHRLSTRSRAVLRSPGTLRLHLVFEGRHGAKYPVQFCIAGTEGFWKDFLNSVKPATRRILNPHDCE